MAVKILQQGIIYFILKLQKNWAKFWWNEESQGYILYFYIVLQDFY